MFFIYCILIFFLTFAPCFGGNSNSDIYLLQSNINKPNDRHLLNILNFQNKIKLINDNHGEKEIYFTVEKDKYRYLSNVFDKHHIITDLLTTNFSRYEENYVTPVNENYDKNKYNTLAQIMQELQRLEGVCNRTEAISCTTYSIGRSYQGRELTVFKIFKGDGKRQAIWMDSLIHAREWLAGATLMNILDRLVTRYNIDADVTKLVDDYDWYILPVLNPDGYERTWTPGFLNRFWRKSLSPNPGNNACPGKDLNRNYDIKWRTSNNPCADDYPGLKAASESEIRAVQNEGARLATRLKAFVAFHATGRMVLSPYSYSAPNGSCISPERNRENIMRVANAFADAIERTNGQKWKRGILCETIYAAFGSSIDYYVDRFGVSYSYGIEVRGPGMDPPPSAIPLSSNELFKGIVAMVNKIEEMEAAT